MNEFVNILTRLGVRIKENYPNINKGGCCVFASYVAEILYEKGYYVSIRVFDSESTGNINEVRKLKNTIDDKNPMYLYNEENIYFGHVMLELEVNQTRLLYDTDGFDTNTYSDKIPGRLSLEEARRGSSIKNNWNEAFDRKDIPKIKKIIDYYLNQIAEI